MKWTIRNSRKYSQQWMTSPHDLLPLLPPLNTQNPPLSCSSSAACNITFLLQHIVYVQLYAVLFCFSIFSKVAFTFPRVWHNPWTNIFSYMYLTWEFINVLYLTLNLVMGVPNEIWCRLLILCCICSNIDNCRKYLWELILLRKQQFTKFRDHFRFCLDIVTNT